MLARSVMLLLVASFLVPYRAAAGPGADRLLPARGDLSHAMLIQQVEARRSAAAERCGLSPAAAEQVLQTRAAPPINATERWLADKGLRLLYDPNPGACMFGCDQTFDFCMWACDTHFPPAPDCYMHCFRNYSDCLGCCLGPCPGTDIW